MLLPVDGCKNLSLHSTSYGPISGRREARTNFLDGMSSPFVERTYLLRRVQFSNAFCLQVKTPPNKISTIGIMKNTNFMRLLLFILLLYATKCKI